MAETDLLVAVAIVVGMAALPWVAGLLLWAIDRAIPGGGER